MLIYLVFRAVITKTHRSIEQAVKPRKMACKTGSKGAIVLPARGKKKLYVAFMQFQIVFRGFMMELARRGHELLVFTPFPANNRSLENYTEVDLHSLSDMYKKQVQYFSIGVDEKWQFGARLVEFSETISDITLSHPVMQRLIAPNSTEKFDLILIQCLFHDALYALSTRLNAPMVGITSSNILSPLSNMFGTCAKESYERYIANGAVLFN